jgi:hypothetical protein
MGHSAIGRVKMADNAVAETLRTLIDLIQRSRDLRDQTGASPQEIRRVDVMIDWTIEALREHVTSEMILRSTRIRSASH